MVLDNGMKKICPVIEDQNDFNDFYSQYAQGRYIGIRVWAIKRDEIHEMVG